MESWSYVSWNKNSVSDESVSGTDGGITRGKNGLMSFTSSSTVMCSGQDAIVRNQEFDGIVSSDAMMRKSMANNSTGDVLSGKFGFERVYKQHPVPPNSASGEEESSSKISSSIAELNSRDSSLIDLKLGRYPDHKDYQTKAIHPNCSQAESSMPGKKARAGNLSSQRAFCQVYGCRNNLSSSKDYHKRHKVCEIHSKTAKVIVNGIEQRFCQQCSRFHLLAEFDDGKRSCRKRLAGHNERRRKPHIGMHSSRAGRFFQSYNGTREGTSFALPSFVCQDILPGTLLHPPKYETDGWYRNDGAIYCPEIAIPNPKRQTHLKSQMSSFSSEKENPHFPDDGLIAMMRNGTSERSNSFLHNMATLDSDPHSLFHSTTIGSEDLTVLDSSSDAQEQPTVSNSGCALSLLSLQSQNSSNQSGVPTSVSLITPSSHVRYSMTQFPEKLMRVSSQTSTTALSNTFHLSAISSAKEMHMEPILISDNVDSVNYAISRVIHGSGFMNAKNNLCCKNGSTIDLLQLSSQLQRVEHERQSMQVKKENDDLFGLRIT